MRLFGFVAALIGSVLVIQTPAQASSYIFGWSPTGNQNLILNGSTAVSARNTGWYDSSGYHDFLNTNYFTSNGYDYGLGNASYNSFFVFDLSSYNGGPITSASLSIGNSPIGYFGNPTALSFFDVTSDINALVSGGVDLTGLYQDLGSGVLFGSRHVSLADNDSQVVITLNGAALTALNDAIGSQIAFGGTLSAVPEPQTWGMMILGFGVIGFALRRKNAAAVRATLAA